MVSLILLVDDDEFARGFARAVLERAGWAVHEAETVAMATSAAESLQLAAAVTDWHLPDGDGAELARRLHEKSPRLPMILITADPLALDSVRDEASSEFSSVLRKPFSPSALVEAIRAALSGGTEK